MLNKNIALDCGKFMATREKPYRDYNGCSFQSNYYYSSKVSIFSSTFCKENVNVSYLRSTSKHLKLLTTKSLVTS